MEVEKGGGGGGIAHTGKALPLRVANNQLWNLHDLVVK